MFQFFYQFVNLVIQLGQKLLSFTFSSLILSFVFLFIAFSF